MKKRYLDPEDREEQRLRKLKTRTPVCVHCNESDSRCLERHHIAGKKHHEDTVILCRNCHRKLSDQQFDHAPFLNAVRKGDVVTIASYLLGLRDLLAPVVETLPEFVDSLINQSKD
jgi:hypothetical protein